MDRRHFLAMFGTVAVAGCSGDGDTGSDDPPTDSPTATSTPTVTAVGSTPAADATAAPSTETAGQTANDTPTPTDTATPTEEPTPTETATPDPATFEVVSTGSPDTIQVGEEHTISVTVENVGGQSGAFEGTLQLSIVGESRWEDVGVIALEDVDPGSTATWTSDSFTYEDAYELQFRIAEYGTRFSYDVVIPEPEIEIGDTQLVEVDRGYEVRPMAEVEVTNTGEGPTGNFSITVDWYDGEGNYLASTDTDIPTLAADETWLPRTDPFIDVENTDAIADFDVSVGQVEGTASLDPESVSLTDDQLQASEENVLVRGTAQNNREETLSYLGVAVKVYNAQEEIIGHAYTNESDIAAGGTLNFEVEPDTNGRNGLVESHDVALSESTLFF